MGRCLQFLWCAVWRYLLLTAFLSAFCLRLGQALRLRCLWLWLTADVSDVSDILCCVLLMQLFVIAHGSIRELSAFAVLELHLTTVSILLLQSVERSCTTVLGITLLCFSSPACGF